MKLMLIAGACPNFMKIAPITRELALHPDIDAMLVHTGQHYDEKMSDLFFRQLGLPKPDINLEVGDARSRSRVGPASRPRDRMAPRIPATAAV